MNQGRERLETVLTTLPEPAAEKIRWLLEGTTIHNRPWPAERMETLSQVLPESEMAELREIFDVGQGDTAKEKCIFDYLAKKYPTNSENEMFFVVYAAANCMPTEEFKRNWQTTMSCAG